MTHALILAASSTLGRSLSRQLGARGFALTLTGRDATALAELKADIVARSAVQVNTHVYDVEHGDPAALMAEVGAVTHLFTLPGWIASEVPRVTQINYTGAAALIEHVWPRMKAAGMGAIVIVSSVAGDRGRGSNYIYGAAKAALSTYTDGLRHHLRDTKLHVMTVKPGFIDSPMTFGRDLPLVASPDDVARAILRGMDRKATTLYAPWFWRYIMFVVRHLPEFLFRKLSW